VVLSVVLVRLVPEMKKPRRWSARGRANALCGVRLT